MVLYDKFEKESDFIDSKEKRFLDNTLMNIRKGFWNLVKHSKKRFEVKFLSLFIEEKMYSEVLSRSFDSLYFHSVGAFSEISVFETEDQKLIFCLCKNNISIIGCLSHY